MEPSVLIALAVILACLAAAYFWRNTRNNERTPVGSLAVASPEKRPASPAAVPDRVVIGQTPSAPVVTIEVLSDVAAFEQAKPIDPESSKSISKLGALIQAVPSILVAAESHGKKLMEVTINGDLVRAADGGGYRAFATNGREIVEHAKLFEVGRLQNLINVAAVMQIASVVVAQKHLADISQKLDEIKDGVRGISAFLDNQRRARIEGAFDYLGQVFHALQGGDFPSASRTELENCERDLLEIQRHLEVEYRQKVAKKVEPSDTFGTGNQKRGLEQKISDLQELAGDIALCMKTRIAAWHVLSLFPGDPNLKVARKQSIEKSIESFSALGTILKDAIDAEIGGLTSRVNREATLKNRRDELKATCHQAACNLDDHVQRGLTQISRGESLLREHDQPSRLIIQIEDGQIVEARQATSLR